LLKTHQQILHLARPLIPFQQPM
jgi:hypothetical protein